MSYDSISPKNGMFVDLKSCDIGRITTITQLATSTGTPTLSMSMVAYQLDNLVFAAVNGFTFTATSAFVHTTPLTSIPIPIYFNDFLIIADENGTKIPLRVQQAPSTRYLTFSKIGDNPALIDATPYTVPPFVFYYNI